MTLLKYIFAILVTLPILFLGFYLLRQYSGEIKSKNSSADSNPRKRRGSK